MGDARDFERKRLGSNAPTPSSIPRSVTSGGERLETSSRAVTHDDRPDKRRRLDRDDNMAPVLHSRVANDRVHERHDGGGSHSVHPRNALSPQSLTITAEDHHTITGAVMLNKVATIRHIGSAESFCHISCEPIGINGSFLPPLIL